MHGLMREGWHLVTMIRLVRHRQTKGAGTDRPCLRLRDACSLLYRNRRNWISASGRFTLVLCLPADTGQGDVARDRASAGAKGADGARGEAQRLGGLG